MRRRRTPPSRPVDYPDWVGGETVVMVCHPDWRGIRSAADATGYPVIRAEQLTPDIVEELPTSVTTIVVQGFPPGTPVLVEAASTVGLRAACVLHSSPAQHGGEPLEARAVETLLELVSKGHLDRVGFVKRGVAEAFVRLGVPAFHVPNRLPRPTPGPAVDLGPGSHVGIFVEPIFRKNVATQMLAVALLEATTAHTLGRPDLAYLDWIPTRLHGVLDRQAFLSLMASVDLNLYVTLSECHPMIPMESYHLGVPCLVSPTSELFYDDPDLRPLTVVDRLDDPTAIAASARRLLAETTDVVPAARNWLEKMDRRSRDAIEDFLAF